MLLLAAIYAGRTHHLFIPLVIVAEATGAILGDNLGFWADAGAATVFSAATVATFGLMSVS